MELLNDWSTNGVGVFGFDDDCLAGSVDDFLYQDISAFVSPTVGLSNVLVAKITEYILDYVFELEPGEVV
ncbi:hypothetical protein SAMN05444271_11831 [Halohasta litchfieldiae]|jgi:hypothetical protein|uniref:Uncharacterized protein n=1 Tax=Halohasta litchfieldiae TaxID=1073996 RepID=A0A1H6VU65_9EURY|nr:hypothetical protein SAMN05444271_11831 [Halohasta litchfieldiae]